VKSAPHTIGPWSHIHALKEFYARISAEGGLSVAEFQKDLGDLFERPRSADAINYSVPS
jgi:hypothetical protein